LGDVSVYAARAALSAKWQGKYLIAHDALLDGPRLSNNEVVDTVLIRAGIDIYKLKQDESSHATELNAQLEHNNNEARALGVRGTPGILINGRVATGIVDPDALKRLIVKTKATFP
jgi:protein-disulfide isomerase